MNEVEPHRPGAFERFAPAREFARMVVARRAWVLAPLLVAITAILVFAAVAEMPVLIPFFYAIF